MVVSVIKKISFLLSVLFFVIVNVSVVKANGSLKSLSMGGVRSLDLLTDPLKFQRQVFPLENRLFNHDSIRASLNVNGTLYIANKQGAVYRRDTNGQWSNLIRFTSQVAISSLYFDPRPSVNRLYIGTGSVEMRHGGGRDQHPIPESSEQQYGMLISLEDPDGLSVGEVNIETLKADPRIKKRRLFPASDRKGNPINNGINISC